MKINVFWFRRDLRLHDNIALCHALNSGLPVKTVYIFDTNITEELPPDDPGTGFIYKTLFSINQHLQNEGSSITVLKGDPGEKWKELAASGEIDTVFANKEYEPYALERDRKIEELLKERNIAFKRFKDHVIYEEHDVVRADGKPYTVFTPYKKRWLQKFTADRTHNLCNEPVAANRFLKKSTLFPAINELGIEANQAVVRPFDLSVIPEYHLFRDFPAADRTSHLSPHLRFGTVSIRKIVEKAVKENPVFLSELIWREFFMQILFHFPHVVTGNFKASYDDIQWRNDEKEFSRWCNGETGYPIVDAGMRQLNCTGLMHNRVRMIAAGFLCRHLLIDWRWGEAYFAGKLLDYELSSNNGNWQWAAGTGCDAAPWFRIFNPSTQQRKFDPEDIYVKKWIGEYGRSGYGPEMVDHEYARERALETYKSGLRRRSNIG